jgi:hypothetical protein
MKSETTQGRLIFIGLKISEAVLNQNCCVCGKAAAEKEEEAGSSSVDGGGGDRHK